MKPREKELRPHLSLFPSNAAQAGFATEMMHIITTVTAGALVHPIFGALAAWWWASFWFWNNIVVPWRHPDEEHLTQEQRADIAVQGMFDGRFDTMEKRIMALEAAAPRGGFFARLRRR